MVKWGLRADNHRKEWKKAQDRSVRYISSGQVEFIMGEFLSVLGEFKEAASFYLLFMPDLTDEDDKKDLMEIKLGHCFYQLENYKMAVKYFSRNSANKAKLLAKDDLKIYFNHLQQSVKKTQRQPDLRFLADLLWLE